MAYNIYIYIIPRPIWRIYLFIYLYIYLFIFVYTYIILKYRFPACHVPGSANDDGDAVLLEVYS